MRRGEIYLAPFSYADLQGSKRRPVCVVSSSAFNTGPDIIVAMVTSNARRLAFPTSGDVVVGDWRQAGLLLPSVVRCGRLLVLETRLLSARLGTLAPSDLAEVNHGLKDALGLT